MSAEKNEIPRFVPSDHPRIQDRIQEALGEVSHGEQERMYQAAQAGSAVHLAVDVSDAMGETAYTVVEVAVSIA